MLHSSTSMVGITLVVMMAGCGGAAGVTNEPTSAPVEAAERSTSAEEEQAGPGKEQQAGDAEEERVYAEVMDTRIKVDLPAVPEFIVPVANADGSHSTREMRLKGKSYLNQKIRITGTVLWIYDCAQSIRTHEMSDKDVRRILETQPERCTRPHFTLGKSTAPSTERGVEVVEYPRPLSRDEKMALGDDLVAELEAAAAAMPAFRVGDRVMVTGTWSLQSPKGFRNSEGLLIFKSMVNLTSPSTSK